jgi:hypothetical protein
MEDPSQTQIGQILRGTNPSIEQSKYKCNQPEWTKPDLTCYVTKPEWTKPI